MNQKKSAFRYLLIVVMLFQAISAMGGGAVFILSPSGTMMGMPASVLEGSPFHDFLFPGLILFLVLGVVPLVTFYGLMKQQPFHAAERLSVFKDMHWAWNFSFYTGIMLIVWINVEQLVLRSFDILQFIYSMIGVIIVVLTNLPSVKEWYRIHPGEGQTFKSSFNLDK